MPAPEQLSSWRFRLARGGEQEWNWQQGPPPLHELAPVRRAAADAMSRHAPVHMACKTTGTYIVLESGLEYELARELDRDPSVVWLVPQPAIVTTVDGKRHVPDLLAVHADGRVVVWDARPAPRRDEAFKRTAELTRQACVEVGWEYALYDAASMVRRINVLCLSAFRHEPEWPYATAKRHLLIGASLGATVSSLMGLDEGDGHTIALMWHLLWSGELLVDLDQRIMADSPVARREASGV